MQVQQGLAAQNSFKGLAETDCRNFNTLFIPAPRRGGKGLGIRAGLKRKNCYTVDGFSRFFQLG